jgi:hypothetical protein
MAGFFAFTICFTILIAYSGCAGVQRQEDSEKFIRLVNMATNQDNMEIILKGVESGHPAILKIPKGMEVPLQINLDSPLLSLTQKSVILHCIAGRNFFIKLRKDEAKVSLDGQYWVDAKNIALVKSMFGFQRGVFKIALNSDKSGEALFVLNISTQ